MKQREHEALDRFAVLNKLSLPGEADFAHACPGRGAAFFTLLRRAGTVPNARVRYGPGLAAHHAEDGVLRSIRGTKATPRIPHLPGRRLVLTLQGASE
jgi:hypothetical protein